MKITLSSFNPLSGAVHANKEQVLELLRSVTPKGDVLVLPEAALCGVPLFDLFDNKQLLAQNLQALKEIAKSVKDTALIIGYMDKEEKSHVTAAAFIYKGKITKIFDSEVVELKGQQVQIIVGSSPEDVSADADADSVIFLNTRP